MLMTLVLAMVNLMPVARAAFEIEDQAFFARAKPLISQFVAEQEQAYGMAFPLDDRTWGINGFIYGTHAMALPVFNGGRWDSSCREISVQLKDSMHQRAHFFVRVTYPKNKIIARPAGADPFFELVPSCNKLTAHLGHPEMIIDGMVKDRLFDDPEFVARSTPLLKAFLRAHHKSDALDPASFSLRRKGVDLDDNRGPFGWLYLKLLERNVACRRVRVYVPAEKAVLTAFVSVMYNVDQLAPNLSAETQSVLMDQRTLRPYRFALVNGCDRGGFFEPPTLRLKPASAPTAPPVAPTEPSPST